MPYQQRNTIVAVFTNLIVMSVFVWWVWGLHAEGAFAGADGLAVWAQTVLWIIPASVVATIILTIVFNIIFAIITREPNPSFVVDERDRVISNKGMMTTIAVASAGFIAAVGALAFGWEAFWALNIILGGFALADLAGSVTKLALYRRGY